MRAVTDGGRAYLTETEKAVVICWRRFLASSPVAHMLGFERVAVQYWLPATTVRDEDERVSDKLTHTYKYIDR